MKMLAYEDLKEKNSVLCHYGRKGMKWGQHIFGKEKTKSLSKTYDSDGDYDYRAKTINGKLSAIEARQLNLFSKDSNMADYIAVQVAMTPSVQKARSRLQKSSESNLKKQRDILTYLYKNPTENKAYLYDAEQMLKKYATKDKSFAGYEDGESLSFIMYCAKNQIDLNKAIDNAKSTLKAYYTSTEKEIDALMNTSDYRDFLHSQARNATEVLFSSKNVKVKAKKNKDNRRDSDFLRTKVYIQDGMSALYRKQAIESCKYFSTRMIYNDENYYNYPFVLEAADIDFCEKSVRDLYNIAKKYYAGTR